MIGERDEGCHEPGGERLWNESYYFNFFDRAGGLGGFTRVGMSPNLALGDHILCLFLPDGNLALARDSAPILGNPARVRVGALAHECLEPMAAWRLTYEGLLNLVSDPGVLKDPLTLPLRPFDRIEVALDLTFRNLNPPVDYHGEALKRGLAKSLADPFGRLKGKSLAMEAVKLFPRLVSLPAMGRARHYEQAGTYEGTVRIGRRTHDFRGTGERDRSWGVRDWRVPARWCWFTGQFGEGKDLVAFNVCSVEMMLLRAFGGFVFEGGRNHLVEDLEIETRFEADGVTQRSMRFTARYGGGRKLEVSGQVKRVAPVAFASGLYRILVNEGMTEFTCRAGTCHGVSEYLFQL